ncbi:MAG TPA: hypothetical protein VHD60_03170 [Candidatus Saccharimonadales bacterium]|nr:hypothetical protein [Candidatus Saccharimonadales bacterium]
MAARAETLDLQTDAFGWAFAESQFMQQPYIDVISEAEMYLSAPETEIYGRSLSAIRRLGAFMIKKTAPETIASPEAAQAKAEFYTSVEEGFGTDMELGGGLEVRDFDERPIMNGRVMSKDLKTAISDMTRAGLLCAEETAQKDPRFLPQLTRSKWDHENALLVDKMARGETGYNTRIVISPFPEEAAARSGNAYWRKVGYVPHLKRGFVQLYFSVGREVITGSLSFDGSNKQQLREIFGRLGIPIPVGEVTDNWLKYALTGNFSVDEAKALATQIADTAGNSNYKKNTNTVDVAKRYRPLMERVFNESYIHICESLARGWQTEGARDLIYRFADQAHHFNERYQQALYKMRKNKNQFTDDDSIILHELLVYSTIEMMRALHLKSTEVSHDSNAMSAYLQAIEGSMFQSMLGGFGADGAMNNHIYSACGLEINAGSDENQLSPQSSFGGVDIDRFIEHDEKGSRKFECPKCHKTNRRPLNKLIPNCVHCGADVSCK